MPCDKPILDKWASLSLNENKVGTLTVQLATNRVPHAMFCAIHKHSKGYTYFYIMPSLSLLTIDMRIFSYVRFTYIRYDKSFPHRSRNGQDLTQTFISWSPELCFAQTRACVIWQNVLWVYFTKISTDNSCDNLVPSRQLLWHNNVSSEVLPKTTLLSLTPPLWLILSAHTWLVWLFDSHLNFVCLGLTHVPILRRKVK